jgi:hypothetical protein
MAESMYEVFCPETPRNYLNLQNTTPRNVRGSLDAVATPAAMIAGMLVGAAVFTDLPPFVKWSLAIIAGGAAAGMVQGATGLLRLKSTALSGGLANPWCPPSSSSARS